MKTLRMLIALLIMFLSTSCFVSKNETITEPTLTIDESKKIVRDLLKNNAGCQLPCWWGITPGKTAWSEARQILETVSRHIGVAGQASDEIFSVSVQALLPYPYNFATYMEHLYSVKNGIVDYIRIYNFDLAPNYFLPNFLEAYGQPDEIWIRTFPKEEMGIQHFIIDVFYQGILIEYSTGEPMKEVGGKLQNCWITEMNSPFLHLWSPETQNLSFQEAKKFIDTRGLPEPKPLLEATGMDVKTFYETFKNPDTNVCLETPKRMWEYK